jgi:hypothetical protein
MMWNAVRQKLGVFARARLLQEQAHVWALKMLELVGVTDFDWSECMRYTRAKKKRR